MLVQTIVIGAEVRVRWGFPQLLGLASKTLAGTERASSLFEDCLRVDGDFDEIANDDPAPV